MEKDTRDFHARIDDLPQMLNWVRSKLEDISLDHLVKKRIELALEEAIVNIITHALDEREELSISYRLDSGRQLEFALSDPGPAFNPLAHYKAPDVTASLEEREIGGLGLSLMHEYMDSLLYRREDDQNILTLIKELS